MDCFNAFAMTDSDDRQRTKRVSKANSPFVSLQATLLRGNPQNTSLRALLSYHCERKRSNPENIKRDILLRLTARKDEKKDIDNKGRDNQVLLLP